MSSWTRVGACVALWALIGCGETAPSGPEAGAERGPCYGNRTCNEGLVCLSDVCVAPGDAGSPADAGSGPADAGAADAELQPEAGLPDSGEGPADTGAEDASAPDATLDAGGADAAPDAGTPDAGAADAGPADAGTPDAGSPDAGPDAMCNPVDTTGCAGSTDLCFWDPRVDRRRCGGPNGNFGLEAACDEALQNCSPGFACAQTGAQASPECHRVCDVFSGGLSCQGLNGRHPVYNCSVINGSAQYGVCLGRGTFCDPLVPSCPAGEVCSFDGANQTTCQMAGATLRDQSCSAVANCAPGQGICIDLGSGGNCRLACDPNMPATCGANSRCVQLVNRAFGVCLPVACQPFTNPCPAGSVCSAVNGPVECRPAGSVGLGGACSPTSECASGVCVDVGAGARCEQPCDGNNACGAPQICVTLTGFGFGICR